ncbi:MAG: ribosome-binding factor A [Candidatus Karelsulcia muelleri]
MFKNKKAAILIKKKLSEIFNRELIYFPYRKLIIITKVIHDFSLAKIYISFFPKEKENNLIKILNNQSKYYKKNLFKKLRFKFKKMPNLLFKIDDSPNI